MNKKLPYSKQFIDNKDINEVVKSLQKEIITGGSTSLKFEKLFSKIVKSKYAVSCSNGTAALHLTSLALEISKKDCVIVPAITYAATANAFSIMGAKIVLCDVNPYNGLITSKELNDCLDKNSELNPNYLCAVNLNGQLCNPVEISKICKLHDITLIFDSSHSLGANFNNEGASLNQYAISSTFSFHPVKTITTIEGGMVTTNDKIIYEKLLMHRENGIEKNFKNFKNIDNAKDTKGNINPWYYEVKKISLNYRLNEISCALGLSQLKKLNFFQKRRKKIFDYYNSIFKNSEFIKPFLQIENQINSMHLYPLLISFEKIQTTRAELIFKLREKKIYTQVHYIPLHFHPLYKNNKNKLNLKGSEIYYSKCLSIPVFPEMTIDDAKYVAKNILKYVN